MSGHSILTSELRDNKFPFWTILSPKSPMTGDVQGDRRDDPHGGQERGREDQLQRVPGDDGGSPTYHAR